MFATAFLKCDWSCNCFKVFKWDIELPCLARVEVLKFTHPFANGFFGPYDNMHDKSFRHRNHK